MSVQSMKYHNLPTAKQIEAYNTGRMSTGERKWMDSMIKRNPFVKESVEAAKTADMAAVGRISSYMSTNVTAQYLTKVGFWSKYGGWISFGSIAVIIGLGVFFGPDLYNKYTNDPVTQNEEVIYDANGQEVIQDNSEASVKSPVISTSSSNELKKNNSEIDKSIVEDEVSSEVLVITETTGVEEDQVNTGEVENKNATTTVAAEEKKVEKTDTSKEAVLTVLSARKAAISSKFDPDSKTASNFPTYPGGDAALCDYFKSKLRAIQVPDASKFSKKATIVLKVNAKGKVTGSSISGTIHPTHEAALNTAIENLPKFDSGKSKVQYSVVVSF